MATKKTSTRRKTTTKKSSYKAGTGKIKTKAGVIKPKASLRRRTGATLDPYGREAREKLAPLPESCHYTKSGAKRSADKLRANGVKARVVSSGRYQCVYTVGKCSKGAK